MDGEKVEGKQPTITEGYLNEFENRISRLHENLSISEETMSRIHGHLSKINNGYAPPPEEVSKEQDKAPTVEANTLALQLKAGVDAIIKVEGRIRNLNEALSSELENISQFI